MLIIFMDLPWREKRVTQEEKRVSWNLAKIGGWNRYNVLTDECSEALDKVISDKTKTIEEVAEKVEKIHEKVMFKSLVK